jgi:hypothetical protein
VKCRNWNNKEEITTEKFKITPYHQKFSNTHTNTHTHTHKSFALSFFCVLLYYQTFYYQLTHKRIPLEVSLKCTLNCDNIKMHGTTLKKKLLLDVIKDVLEQI